MQANRQPITIAPLVEASMEVVMSTFDTNTFGALRMIQAVSPHMMERKKGLIINVSSIVARMYVSASFTITLTLNDSSQHYRPPPFSGPYNASKAALSALTDTLDMELRPFGIHVMLLSTGLVRSHIADNYASHTGVKLPSESAYSAYSEQVEGRLHLSQEVCMDTAVFAKRVVRQALKETPSRYLTLGGNSATVGILESVPRSWRLHLVWNMFTRWTGLMRRIVLFMSIFE
jgi:1-acylglycerone phosphate reductase